MKRLLSGIVSASDDDKEVTCWTCGGTGLGDGEIGQCKECGGSGKTTM